MLLTTKKDDFIDCNLVTLCEFLDMLDKKISEIVSLISISHDPESDGLFDKGEYFIGIGFVAIQQHLVDTLLFTGLRKNDAYKLGAIHSTGITYISLINSAANWWKHESEWVNNGEVPKNGTNTFEHVFAISETTDYALSNVLASICGSEKLSFSAVIPYLAEWQKNIFSSIKNKDITSS